MAHNAGALKASLMAFAGSGNVADRLLAGAEFTKGQVTFTKTLGGDLKVTAGALRSAGRKGVATYTILASQSRDPDVLDWLAHRPQISVKRAVAGNPHITPETSEYLWAWAGGKWEPDIVNGLARSQPIAHTRAMLGKHHPSAVPNAQAILCSLQKHQDGQSVREEFSEHADAAERAMILCRVADGKLVGDTAGLLSLLCQVDLEDAICELAARGAAIGNLDRRSLLILTDLAANQAAPDGEVNSGPRQRRDRHALAAVLAAQLHPLDYDLVERLLDTQDDLFASAAVTNLGVYWGEAPQELIEKAAAFTKANCANALFEHHSGLLGIADAERLAERYTLDAIAAGQALEHHVEHLRPQTVAALLEQAGSETVRQWLRGELPSGPTSAVLSLLGERRGNSRTVVLMDHLPVMAGREKAGTDPAYAEAFNQCGSNAVRAATIIGPCAAYVAGRLTDRFGDDADAWEAAAELGGQVDLDTVDDWLDVIETTVQL